MMERKTFLSFKVQTDKLTHLETENVVVYNNNSIIERDFDS